MNLPVGINADSQHLIDSGLITPARVLEEVIPNRVDHTQNSGINQPERDPAVFIAVLSAIECFDAGSIAKNKNGILKGFSCLPGLVSALF
jgi:hypothetical protein